MLENLQFIEEFGIRKFIEYEKERWMKGDKVFCVHKKNVLSGWKNMNFTL